MKNFDPPKDTRKNIFNPRNPRKNYDLRKNYFDTRNPRDLADSMGFYQVRKIYLILVSITQNYRAMVDFFKNNECFHPPFHRREYLAHMI